MSEVHAGDLEWSLQSYRPGDENEILELFNTVFGLERTLEHWNWKFNQNPWGGPFATLVRRKTDGKLIGTHMVMPFPLNVKGRPVVACQTVDLVVHPEFRRRGIFGVLAREGYDACRKAGIQAVIAFPNPQGDSYPGFVRTLGWDRILFPDLFRYRLRIDSKLRRIVKPVLLSSVLSWAYSRFTRLQIGLRQWSTGSGRQPELRFGVSTRVPELYGALWTSWCSQEILSVWKDEGYLRWRYEANPDHDFEFSYLSRGEELLAMSVGVERAGKITLCELIVRDRNIAIGRKFLNELALHSWSRGIEEIQFLGRDNGFFRDVFAGIPRRVVHENVLVGTTLESGEIEQLFPHAANWTMTFGDADFV